ncbi:MAG: rhodanese-related sulfurtransferase, partial [Pyrinomonadaceae bacterium]
MNQDVEIISFYEFKKLPSDGGLEDIRGQLRQLFIDLNIRGTIILASEGYNGMVCGVRAAIEEFIPKLEGVLKTKLNYKSSNHAAAPFRKIDVKIKPEIVTLKREVDISLGRGTHLRPADWNEVLSDPDVILLDTRNDYEFQSGTFRGAINPGTAKFSELPAFVAEHFDPKKHKKIAMFCTGGIRCEKFAPYMKQIGFEEVYQLEGGILKYLEETPIEETLWEGECFVFDERITV